MGCFYHHLIREAFNYRSPGYRDWKLYSDEASFKESLLNYVQPGNYVFLRNSGTAVEELIYSMIGTARNGFVEKSLYKISQGIANLTTLPPENN